MIAYLFQKYPENFALQLFIILQQLAVKFAIFLNNNLFIQFIFYF